MAHCCHVPRGYHTLFGEKAARREARRYRRKGLGDNDKRIVDFLLLRGVEGASVLEIGGGVSTLQVELLKGGVERAVNVELSPYWEEEARGLVREAGVEDRWEYPDDGMGDCEDIQLLKRRRLVEAGLPKRALRMAVVLDNAVGAILSWEETGYQFIKREGQEDDRIWIAFGDPQPAPAVTAQR